MEFLVLFLVCLSWCPSRANNIPMDMEGIKYEEYLEQLNNVKPKTTEEMSWTHYHRLSTIYNWMENVTKSHPKNVQLIEIGKSSQNRSLIVMKISFKPQTGSELRPAVFVDGGLHAREWISPSAVTFIANELIQELPKDCSKASNLEPFEMFDWYLLPVANPDGYEFTTQHRCARMWRKTMSVPLNPRGYTYKHQDPAPCVAASRHCLGVDPNRNFAFKWGQSSKTSSRNPCKENYVGPRPGSEPEVQAMQDFLRRNRKTISLYVTVHNYGQLVLVPWSHTRMPPKDLMDLLPIAQKAAVAMEDIFGTEYLAGQASHVLGATASGSSMDFAKGAVGIKYSFGLELRPSKNQIHTLQDSRFHVPTDQIGPTGMEAFAAVRTMATEVARELGMYSTNSMYY